MVEDASFRDTKNAVSSALVETTRAAGRVANEDLAFHRSSNPSVVPLLEEQNARLLSLVRDLTKVATERRNTPAAQVSNQESIEDNWRGFVDIFDGLLEKADACLDEFTGSIKRLSPSIADEANKGAFKAERNRPARTDRTFRIEKPQLSFEKAHDNETTAPFKPLLTSKPHALEPLEESLVLMDSSDQPKQYKHPFETEIRQSRYPPNAFQKADPIPYLSFKDTQATWVDTLEGLQEMLAELKQAREIAVDLEHHDEHSYIGLVSLMQISTREKDWVIDTLKPWRHQLQILNEVFADPQIMKVFHGAFMDMIWLQRDFGLYVVNLFDTYHASCVLRYERHSLAFLLKRFADFDAAKQYQMSDWRIRPLSTEMFDYARSDTHFLLYVYDNMRNELLDWPEQSQAGKSAVESVMMKSKNESLQKYERPVYDFERGSGSLGWFGELLRTPAHFNREQFAVFRAVHQWRDKVARQEDESVHSVISRQVLYSLAREMPTSIPALLGACRNVSDPIRKRKDELLEIIKQAIADGAEGPEMKDHMNYINPTPKIKNATGNTKLHQPLIPHDQQIQKPAVALHGVLPLRSARSIFWGPVPARSAAQPLRNEPDNTIELALPLPPLTAEVFENADGLEEQATRTQSLGPGAMAEHQYTKTRPPVNKPDDVFILKQAGGFRKRKASDQTNPQPKLSSGESKAWDEDANGDGDEEDGEIDEGQDGEQAEVVQLDQQGARKRSKKADKKRRRRERESAAAAAANNSNNNNNNGNPAQPFDYTTAPSVLHAPPEGGRDQRRKGNQKGANPYAKALNAPKGLPRARKEGVGKSYTFAK